MFYGTFFLLNLLLIVSSLTLLLSFIFRNCNSFQSFYKREECNVSTLSFFYLLGKWPSIPIAARSVILWFQGLSWHSLVANPSKTNVKTKYLISGYKFTWADLGQPYFTEQPRAPIIYALFYQKNPNQPNQGSRTNQMLKLQLLPPYWPVR